MDIHGGRNTWNNRKRSKCLNRHESCFWLFFLGSDLAASIGDFDSNLLSSFYDFCSFLALWGVLLWS